MDKQAARKEKIARYKQRMLKGGVYRIVNTRSGKMLLEAAADLAGSKNRFDFSVATGSCVNFKLQRDWLALGAGAFSFEVLEELAQKQDQTEDEFREELEVLRQLWDEKLAALPRY